MCKVFGVLPVELRPGVDEQEFIKFCVKEFFPFGTRLGWKGSILKGDRGDRAGKFAVLWEIPSVEQRDRFVPAPDVFTEECTRLLGPEWDEMGKTLSTYVLDWLPFTDYVEQA
jgi:hypothetical protein